MGPLGFLCTTLPSLAAQAPRKVSGKGTAPKAQPLHMSWSYNSEAAAGGDSIPPGVSSAGHWDVDFKDPDFQAAMGA